MMRAAPGVLRDARLEVTLADEIDPVFAGIVPLVGLRVGPVPGRPGLKHASLTVTFRNDPPGTVSQLLCDMHNSDGPASFKVCSANGSPGYAGEILLPRVRDLLVYDVARPSYPPVTFLVTGEVREVWQGSHR